MQKLLSCSLLLFYFFTSVFAQGNWLTSVGVGPTFINVDNNDFIASGQGWPDDQYRTTKVGATGLFMIDGGYQWTRNEVWFPFYSLTASYAYGFPARVAGQIEQYSLSEFTNYNYQYKIQTQTFLTQIKTDLYQWHDLMPFLLIGIGLSLNNANDYTEQPLSDVTPRVSPGFKNQTKTYFSYAFGAGLDYIVKKNMWVTLTYKYTQLGMAKTGPGADTAMLTDTNYTSDHLKTHLTSNSLFLGITYFFGMDTKTER